MGVFYELVKKQPVQKSPYFTMRYESQQGFEQKNGIFAKTLKSWESDIRTCA